MTKIHFRGEIFQEDDLYAGICPELNVSSFGISIEEAGVKRPLVIKSSPIHVPKTHIRTNLLTAGISRQRYCDLLEKVG